MDIRFDTSLVEGYKSASQIARVLTEDWLARNMYCPVCGADTIRRAEASAPVKDYVCKSCGAQYELKSKKTETNRYDAKVVDGVYCTMIERITSLSNPSFFFMHYDSYGVNNLVVVPNCFFVPEIIERRAVLSANARRAGWEGCNILLGKLPEAAKIPIIVNRNVVEPEKVCRSYKRIYELQSGNLEGRGWIIDVMNCIQRLGSVFTLKQVYDYVDELRAKYPANNNVEAKIRQQLQLLRDRGMIRFVARGEYEKIEF